MLAGVTAVGAQPETFERGSEICSITFEGNASIGSSALRAQMRTQETPGWADKLLYAVNDRLGRRNEYYEPLRLGADLGRLRTYYENRGFSSVRIDTAVQAVPHANAVSITITIHEGYRSLIDSLAYHGLENIPYPVPEEVASGQQIKKGDPYDSDLLEAEIKRVVNILQNNGYPNATYLQDSSRASRFASTGNYSIVLAFKPGRWYVFGPIVIRQEVDTLHGARIRDDITDDIILRQLDYKTGDTYSLANRINSEHNLNRLGIFDLQSIRILVPPENDPYDSVESIITIRPKDRHELAPELITSNENEAFNLGAGLGFTERNFFGGARIFTTRLRFRTQTIEKFPNYFGQTTDAVSNLELSFDMLQPYILTNKVRGNWTFSLIVDKQKPYVQNIVQNKIGFTDRFAEFTNGYLDWTLEAINLRRNPNFVIDSSDVETLRLLRTVLARQLNSILSFTIQRDKSNDIFNPSQGFIHSATFEEAGVLPVLLRNTLTGLPFTQFYSVILTGRWYFDPSGSRFSILALKLRGGLEEKYGESHSDTTRSIPPLHRFYAGGSSSVRGWNSRDLIASGVAQLGGNLQLEGSAELRINLFQSLKDGLLDKIWLVPAIDFGNVWQEVTDFRVNQVAIGGALGLHYDTIFGPFRVDLGFRIYDPGAEPGHRWIIQKKFFGETIGQSIIHFGIGNAF